MAQLQEQTELLGYRTNISLPRTAHYSPAMMSFAGPGHNPLVFSQGGVCGAAQSFIDQVTTGVSDVMKAAEAVESVPIIGGILGAIVRGVQLGLSLITRAVNAVLAPVLGIVRAIGAALSVASTIVGTLSPRTVTLDIRPSVTEVGGIPGEIGISAGGWDQIEIPTAIRECANLAGVDPPQPAAADSPVNLTVRQSRTLVILNTPEVRLDTNGQAVAPYVTGPVTQGDRIVTGMAWITVTVVREDLIRLRDQLFNVLFSSLPGIITDVIRPLIGPIADNLSTRLLALVNAVGVRPLFVQYRERTEEEVEPAEDPDGEGSASGEGNAQSLGCFPGKFRMVDPMALQRMFLPFPMDIEGTNDWDFQAGGRLVVSFNNLVVTVHLDPSFPWDFTFNGTQSGTYGTSSGTLHAEITENNVQITTSMAGASASLIQSEFAGASAGGAPLSGSYECGDPLVWNPVYPEVGQVRYEFEPID